jgi:tRNA threonylcarbamoyladenosine biosynthesis protein TsaB
MSDDDTSPRPFLGLDTVTPIQSIGLVEGERVLDACERRVSYDHSSTLLDNIRNLLEARSLALEDLAGIAVGIGPGSFTGARIGLALAKGLARGSDLPLVGLSSLACLTFRQAVAHPGDDVCGAYDARRDEVYTGTYRWTGDVLETIEEDRIAQPDTLREQFERRADDGRVTWLVGNGVQTFEPLGRQGRNGIHPLPAWEQGPSGVAAALLGQRRLEETGADDLDVLEPNYIRPSSAEENRREEENAS